APLGAPGGSGMRCMIGRGDTSLESSGCGGGLPRSWGHGLNGFDGLNGSLACEGGVRRSVATLDCFCRKNNTKVVAGYRALSVSKTIRSIRQIRSIRVPQSEEAPPLRPNPRRVLVTATRRPMMWYRP